MTVHVTRAAALYPGYAVTSESCALGTIGARYLREVHPGEIVRLDRHGLHSFQGRAAALAPALSATNS